MMVLLYCAAAADADKDTQDVSFCVRVVGSHLSTSLVGQVVAINTLQQQQYQQHNWQRDNDNSNYHNNHNNHDDKTINKKQQRGKNALLISHDSRTAVYLHSKNTLH